MIDFDPAVTSRLVPRWNAQRMAENFGEIERRLRRKRASRPWALALAALAMSGALVGVFFGFWPAGKPSLAGVSHTALSSAVTAHMPGTETRFRDGSTATALTEGAVLELRTTSDTEMIVVAKSGNFRFDVTPNPARRFVVETGNVSVRVLGTRFIVVRQDQRVQVRVERGHVEVAWPEGHTELRAEESGWFPPLPQTLEPALASSSEPSPSAERGSHANNERSQFIELTHKGDYLAAYAILDRNPQLFGNSAEDLMLAADAARLSNHPQQAVVYLQRITKEHSGDSRAPLAAFTLGRIYMSQLNQPAFAAQAFSLVRQLAPAGALVEDAMARQAEALEQAGQHEAAQRLVAAYLRQYPGGRRGERLRELVRPSP